MFWDGAVAYCASNNMASEEVSLKAAMFILLSVIRTVKGGGKN